MHLARAAAAAIAVVACDQPRPQPASAQGYQTPLEFQITGFFASPRIRESSGVAASRRHRPILWTHNDSGDDPVIYATDLEGRDLGFVRVAGAQARDWEDLALGPCPAASGDCLYIADTGDNDQKRREARIYILPEPGVPVPSGPVEARTVTLRFTDRPYNIEALAVEPSGAVWLFSKGLADTAIFVFRIPADELTNDSIAMTATGRLDFDPITPVGQVVTGAAISALGARLAVRTYTQIFFYRITGEQLTRESVCWIGPLEPQGEAIDFLDESTMVLTSESAGGRPAPISRIRCPLS